MGIAVRFKAGSAGRGAASIMGATAIGQALALAASPVLSRIYPPEVFGPFAVVNSVLLPLSTVAALRYEMAIPAADDEREAALIARLGLGVATALCGLVLVVVLALGRRLATWVGLESVSWPLLLWVPVIGLLLGSFNVLNQLAIRHRLYSVIARRNILQLTAVVALQLLLGIAGFGAHGLAMGLAGGQLIGVMALLLSLRDQLRGHPLADLAATARRHRRVAMLMAPSGLLNTAGLQAPVVVASIVFTATDAGVLGMTQRVLALPVTLIGSAVAQVFLGEFGAAHRQSERKLIPLFMAATTRLAAVAGIVLVLVAALGPWAFGWALGEEWAESGYVAQALAIGLAGQLVASPLSQTLVVLGRYGQQFAWDAGRLLLCGGAVWMGYALGWGLVRTMWLLGGAMAMTFAASWVLSWVAVRGRDAAG